MTYQHHPPLVAAAVIVHRRRLLLVRRVRTEPGLVWALPAGKPEGYERLEETAERETWEETGLRVKATEHLGDRIHPLTGWSVHYIACTLQDDTAPKPRLAEIEEVTWAAHDTLSEHVPGGFDPRVQQYINTACARPRTS
ncbi:NUDIX hydrolase [Streptomyces sp. NPDC020965]|uniref:NUDIX hydrolase n=1 Tax=Streptomyces sp. NPDC020965 TaxID=3365105 RepID=UPI0037B0AE08